MLPSQHQLYHNQSPENICLGIVTELLQKEYYCFQQRMKITNDIFNHIRSISANEGPSLSVDKAYAMAKKFELILFRKSSSFEDYSDTATLKFRLKMLATKIKCNIEERKKAVKTKQEPSKNGFDNLQNLSISMEKTEIDDDLFQLAFQEEKLSEK